MLSLPCALPLRRIFRAILLLLCCGLFLPMWAQNVTPLTLTSVTPAVVPYSADYTRLTLTGDGFTEMSSVVFRRAGYADFDALNTLYMGDPMSLNVNFYPDEPTPGTWDIVVDNGAGQTVTLKNALSITLPAAPAVTAASPAKGENTGPVTLTLTGTGFFDGATIALPATATALAIPVGTVTVTSSTQLTATVNLAGAPIGPRSLVVTNVDGQASAPANGFAIIPKVTIAADAYTVAENGMLTVAAADGVFKNDTTTGGTLTAVKQSGPSHGTLILNADGDFTYTPTANWYGTDSFTYTASAGGVTSAPVTVTLTVTASPAPTLTAVNPVQATNTGMATLTLIGTNFVTGVTAKLTRTGETDLPLIGLTGTATQLTGAVDLIGKSVGAWTVVVTLPDGQTVSLADGCTVQPVITTTTDVYNAITGQTLTVTAAQGLLANDSTTGGVLTATKAGDPSHGTVLVAANGSFQYSSTAGYYGTDSFRYTASAGGVTSAPVTVTLTVKAPGPSITSIMPVTATTLGPYNFTISGGNFLFNATATFTQAGQPAVALMTPVVTATKITGSATFPAPGVWTLVVANPDGQAVQLANAFTILTNQPPVVTVTGTLEAVENVAMPLGTAVAVTDPDAIDVPIQVTLSASKGKLSLAATTGVNISGSGTSTLTLFGEQNVLATALPAVTYQCNDYNGVDAVTITANDQGNTGYGGVKINTQTLPVTVTGTPPTVTAVSPATGYGSAVTLTVTGTGFHSGATVTLTKDGEGAITATGLTVTATQITGTLNLTSASSGAWTVGVTNPDGLSAQMPNSFTVLVGNQAPVLTVGYNTMQVVENASVALQPTMGLLNPGAENGLTGWTSSQNVTSVTWSAHTGRYSFDCPSNGQFSQTVDLCASGFTAAYLDTCPPISAGVWATPVSEGAYLTVRLLADDNTPLKVMSCACSQNYSWKPYSLTLTNYPPGVRKLEFILGMSSGYATYTLFDDAWFMLGPAATITVTDADAGMAPLAFTLAAAHGRLTLAAADGVTITGSGTAMLTLRGAQTALTAALTRVTYQCLNYTGPDTLTLTANDQGNSGAGGARTTTRTLSITVTPNQAPVFLGIPEAPQVAEYASVTLAPALAVADADAGANPLRVILSALKGTCTLAATSGVTISGSGTATLMLDGSQTALTAALARVTYQCLDYTGPDTLTLTANDHGNTGVGTAQITTRTLGITVTPVPPVITTVTPEVTAVSGPVTLTVEGAIFRPGAAARLTRVGIPDIPLTGLTITDTRIVGTANLAGAASGPWIVRVTNPDGLSSATERGVVTVGSLGVALQPSVDSVTAFVDTPLFVLANRLVNPGAEMGSISAGWSNDGNWDINRGGYNWTYPPHSGLYCWANFSKVPTALYQTVNLASAGYSAADPNTWSPIRLRLWTAWWVYQSMPHLPHTATLTCLDEKGTPLLTKSQSIPIGAYATWDRAELVIAAPPAATRAVRVSIAMSDYSTLDDLSLTAGLAGARVIDLTTPPATAIVARLTALHGLLTVPATAGVAIAGSGTSTVTLTGTAAAITTALGETTYQCAEEAARETLMLTATVGTRTASTSATLTVQPGAAPTVTAISPTCALNTSPATITLTGTALRQNTQVRLTMAGQPDIPLTNLMVTPTRLTGTATLTGMTPGLYNVVVTYNGTQTVPNTLKFAVQAPITLPNSAYTVQQGHTLTIGAPGVLTGASFAYGTLTAQRITKPDRGAVTVNADGSFIYTTPGNEIRTESFLVTATSGVSVSAPATVTITITRNPALHPPTVTVPARLTALEHAPTTISGVTVGAPYVGANPVLLTLTTTRGTLTVTAAAAVTVTGNGSGTITVRGVVADINTALASLSYQVTDWYGTVTLRATLSDLGNTGAGSVLTADASGAIVVTAAPAPIVTAVAPTTVINTAPVALTLTGTGFRPGATARLTKAGAADIPLTGVTQSGTTGLSGTAVITNAAPGAWTVVVTNPDTQLGRLANGLTISALAGPKNDVYTLNQDTVLTVPQATCVLVNDANITSGCTVALDAGVTRGQLTLQPDGTFTYTPSPHWFGTDSFTYRVVQNGTAGAPTTVTLTVKQVIQPPVAQNLTVTTAYNTPVAIILQGADAPYQNGTLTYVGGDRPAHGVVTGSAPTWTYTPTAGYIGTDRLTYKVYNGTYFSNLAVVTITVNAPALTGVTLQMNPVATRYAVGYPLRLTATAQGGNNVQYRFEGSTDNGATWTALPGQAGYAAANTYNWTPSAVGTVQVRVSACNEGNTASGVRSSAAFICQVVASQLTVTACAQTNGRTVTTIATVSGAVNPVCRFTAAYRISQGIVKLNITKVLQEYGTATTCAWTLPANVTTYTITVDVKEVNSSKDYDARATVSGRAM